VTDGRHHTRIDDLPDRRDGAVALGREGDHPNGARARIEKMLRVEVTVAPDRAATRLAGTGLIVVNPPWTLEGELAVLLPALAAVLGRDGAGTFRVDRLTTEN
jgi:23S rRNA A2030 N6-methylase RlmJ